MGHNHSAVCFNRGPGTVDGSGHWLAAVLNVEGSFIILVNAYGYAGASQNRLMAGKSNRRII